MGLTARDRRDIELFKKVTGSEMLELNRYLSGAWEWHEFWDYNFEHVDTSLIPCRCTFEGLRASGRRVGYPRSINSLERLGFRFSLIRGGGSWYEDGYYQCSCGQHWKEVFVEVMHYNGNHAYPVDAIDVPT